MKRDNTLKSRIWTKLLHKNKMERCWLLWCVNSLFSPLLIQVFSCIFTPDCTFTDTTMNIYTCFSAYLCSNYFVYHCLPTSFMGQELMLLLWSLYSLILSGMLRSCLYCHRNCINGIPAVDSVSTEYWELNFRPSMPTDVSTCVVFRSLMGLLFRVNGPSVTHAWGRGIGWEGVQATPSPF